MSDVIPSVAAISARRSSLNGVASGQLSRGATLQPGPIGARFIFRGDWEAASTAGTAFGPELSLDACRACSTGTRSALWLGPDEWLLIAPGEEPDVVGAALQNGLAAAACSLVDVSHRQLAIVVEGRAAAEILNAAIPIELTITAFPVGMCTRTVFDKAEIVLWRTCAETFHIDVWRSFAPYVWDFLQAVRAESFSTAQSLS